MSQIVDKIKDTVGGAASNVGDYFKDNPDALKTLAGVGGVAALSGLAGGYLSAGAPGSRKETRAQRRKRILLNALLTAGVGGGAAYAGMKGLEKITKPLPADDVPPMARAVESLPARGLMAGTGVGVAHLTKPGVRDIESNFSMHELQKMFKGRNPLDVLNDKQLLNDQLSNLSPAEIAQVKKMVLRSGQELPEELRRSIKLPTSVSGRLPSSVSVFGKTHNIPTSAKLPSWAHQAADSLFGKNLPAVAHARDAQTGLLRYGMRIPRWARTALGGGVGFMLPEVLGLTTNAIGGMFRE